MLILNAFYIYLFRQENLFSAELLFPQLNQQVWFKQTHGPSLDKERTLYNLDRGSCLSPLLKKVKVLLPPLPLPELSMSASDSQQQPSPRSRCHRLWTCIILTGLVSELHGSQVAAGGDCRQHALRQTLGLLHCAATARPVGLPGVSLMAVTAAFKSSCRKTGQEYTALVTRS